MTPKIALAAALVACAAPAVAQTTTIAEAGGWRAFAGTTERGTRTCGMDVRSTDERRFLFQAYEGNNWITARAVSMRWRIPEGTPVPVVIQIGRSIWQVQATGGGMEAQWRIDRTTATEWEAAFRRGSLMLIIFTAGNEQPWRISLHGSNAITTAFSICLDRYLLPAGQPHAAPTSPAAPTPPQAAPLPYRAPPVPSGPERRT